MNIILSKLTYFKEYEKSIYLPKDLAQIVFNYITSNYRLMDKIYIKIQEISVKTLKRKCLTHDINRACTYICKYEVEGKLQRNRPLQVIQNINLSYLNMIEFIEVILCELLKFRTYYRISSKENKLIIKKVKQIQKLIL